MNQKRKVTAIIPNYNYAKYLKKRIKSVLGQTYPIYELIVLDDKSTDESVKIIERMLPQIKKQYPKLKLKFELNAKNSGKATLQWQKGIKLAAGDFIWIAEADDLSNRNFLETVMKSFDDKDVVLSYVESKLINGAGLTIMPNFKWSRDREKTGHYKNDYVKPGVREIEEIMAIRCTIPNVSAVVFRKSAISLETLQEASHFRQVGDWYFYIKILEKGKIAYHEKSLNGFRIHRGSVTRKSNSGLEHYKEILAMHNLLEKKYLLSKDLKLKMQLERERIGNRYGII